MKFTEILAFVATSKFASGFTIPMAKSNPGINPIDFLN
jgi:hypothetical protein